MDATPDPHVEATKSKRLAMIAGSLLLAAMIGVALLYWIQPTGTVAAMPSRPVADPLAARRGSAVEATRPAEEQPAVPAANVTPDQAAYAAGDGARALEQYRLAVERNPNDADARTAMGQMLIRLSRVDDAVAQFQRAVELDGQRPAQHSNLAAALAQLRRWDEAIASYRRAQQITPNDPGLALELAKALNGKGDYAAAVGEFQKVIGADPGNAAVRISLAESYEALNQPQQAAAAYGEYLKLAPNGPDADRARSKIVRLTAPSTNEGE